MLKLKLQYFGHLMWRTTSFEKTLMLGKIEGRRRRGRQRLRWLDQLLTWWTWVWVSSRSWWWIGKPGMLQSMELQRVGHDWATELIWNEQYFHFSLSLPPAQRLAILAFQIIILTLSISRLNICTNAALLVLLKIYPLQLFTPSPLSVSPHSQDG